MTLIFEFPGTEGLEKIRTTLVLDSHGAKLSIAGKSSCACSCHEVPLALRFIVKGKGNEDPIRLDWVERMIRGSTTKGQADSRLAALEMTTLMVQAYLDTFDCCERKVS